MLMGKGATVTDYFDALAQRNDAVAAFAHWMRGRDALVTPMLPITARAVTEVDETTFPLAVWSRAVNYVDACAFAVPAGLSSSGLPIGFQIIGANGADETVTQAARTLHRPSDVRANGSWSRSVLGSNQS